MTTDGWFWGVAQRLEGPVRSPVSDLKGLGLDRVRSIYAIAPGDSPQDYPNPRDAGVPYVSNRDISKGVDNPTHQVHLRLLVKVISHAGKSEETDHATDHERHNRSPE